MCATMPSRFYTNMYIIVGSTSKHKLEAVTNTLQEIFGDEADLKVNYRNVSSQIAAQPVGHEETVRGCSESSVGQTRLIRIHILLMVWLPERNSSVGRYAWR